MGHGWAAVVILAGLVLVAVAGWDIFQTLWNPTGRGAVSRRVMRGVWRLGRRSRAVRRAVGPLAVASAVVVWVTLLVLGFALVYWSQMPEAFVLGPGLVADERTAFIDSLYLSLVAMGTLGFGDIVPRYGWLLVVSPLQSLLGFALLTAGVSWFVQIYPSLARRRALAARLTILERAAVADGLATMSPAGATQVLASVTDGLIDVRIDLRQYVETYYFTDPSPDLSLPRAVRYAVRLAQEGARSPQLEVRSAAAVLEGALTALADVLVESFLPGAPDGGDPLTAYADDHAARSPT